MSLSGVPMKLNIKLIKTLLVISLGVLPVAITSCNLVTDKTISQASQTLNTGDVASLITTQGMSEQEKGVIKKAIGDANRFISDWKYYGIKVIIDRDLIDEFNNDFNHLIETHTQIGDLIAKHRHEYKPEDLIRIEELNSDLVGYAQGLRNLQHKSKYFVTQINIAEQVLEKLPEVAELLKTAL